MQFFKLSYELITDKNITSNEFRVYTYLMSLYNEKQGCSFPSMEKIVEKLGMSKPTVNSAIKKLVTIGYMEVEKQRAKMGNHNKYKKFKHFIQSNKNENSTKVHKVEALVEEPIEKKQTTRKPLIVSDFKESGVQMEITEYSTEHQQKIALVLKQGIKLNDKQQFLIGEMDLETLRKAIHQFKKKKGKYFSLLLNLYIDQAEEIGVYITSDIEKYLKGSYVRVSKEDKETIQALRELELYGVPYGA